MGGTWPVGGGGAMKSSDHHAVCKGGVSFVAELLWDGEENREMGRCV